MVGCAWADAELGACCFDQLLELCTARSVPQIKLIAALFGPARPGQDQRNALQTCLSKSKIPHVFRAFAKELDRKISRLRPLDRKRRHIGFIDNNI